MGSSQPLGADDREGRLDRLGLRGGVYGAFALAALLIAGVFAVLAFSARSTARNADAFQHSTEVRLLAASAERSAIDLETGVRGYLLTGEKQFLEPYRQALVTLRRELPALEAATREAPEQYARAQAITVAVETYERRYAEPLADAPAIAVPLSVRLVTAAGKRLVDALRGRFAAFDAGERTREVALARERSGNTERGVILAGAGLVEVLIVLAALVAYIARRVLAPVRRVAGAAAELATAPEVRVPETGTGEIRQLSRSFNEMARTLAARERALRLTAARLKRIMDHMGSLLYIKDADSRYLLVNEEFERVRGLEASEVLGRGEEELSPGTVGEEVRAADRAVIESGKPMSFEQEFPLADGTHTFLSVKFPIDDPDNEDALGGIATDITDLKMATAAALDASRMKSEFVANMSHEIRTPLNGVVGLTTLLGKTELDPVQRQYVDALATSSEALLGVISNVLDFSKIEAGRLELDPIDFDLRATVEDTTTLLARQAHAKQVEIAHLVDADVPPVVSGDRGRLRQVLLNLLSNAVKFTAEGEVVVRVSRDRGDVLRFEVADTGVGFSDGDTRKLFDAFTQADASTTRRFGGTGLGLAISKDLVTRMGGEIGARPRETGGSVFWFTAELPAAETPASAARERPDLLGRRALIVDDNATNRQIFEQYLRSWGLRCASIGAPAAALATLEDAAKCGEPFDLALIDFNMPGPDGGQLSREIRERPLLRGLPIVIASSTPLDPAPFRAAGVAAILTKPVRQSDLFDAISDALLGPRERIEVPAPESPAVPPAQGAPILLAEDNEVNRVVATALLAQMGCRVDIAHNGREAVEMALAGEYGAILMDVQMPGLDGYAATRTIRGREHGRRVPIIAMTAHSMSGDRERCLAAGMDDYLSKPVRPEDLAAALARWVPTAEKDASPGAPEHGAPGPQREADPGGEVLSSVTISDLRASLTPGVRRGLLETFEQSLPRRLEEIAAAIERADRGEVRRVAHLLKGSAATLGAQELRAACQRLDHTGREGDAPVGTAELDMLGETALRALDALRNALLEDKTSPATGGRSGSAATLG